MQVSHVNASLPIDKRPTVMVAQKVKQTAKDPEIVSLILIL